MYKQLRNTFYFWVFHSILKAREISHKNLNNVPFQFLKKSITPFWTQFSSPSHKSTL